MTSNDLLKGCSHSNGPLQKLDACPLKQDTGISIFPVTRVKKIWEFPKIVIVLGTKGEYSFFNYFDTKKK